MNLKLDMTFSNLLYAIWYFLTTFAVLIVMDALDSSETLLAVYVVIGIAIAISQVVKEVELNKDKKKK